MMTSHYSPASAGKKDDLPRIPRQQQYQHQHLQYSSTTPTSGSSSSSSLPSLPSAPSNNSLAGSNNTPRPSFHTATEASSRNGSQQSVWEKPLRTSSSSIQMTQSPIHQQSPYSYPTAHTSASSSSSSSSNATATIPSSSHRHPKPSNSSTSSSLAHRHSALSLTNLRKSASGFSLSSPATSDGNQSPWSSRNSTVLTGFATANAQGLHSGRNGSSSPQRSYPSTLPFRQWYSKFIYDVAQKIPQQLPHVFPDRIPLQRIYGSRQFYSDDESAVDTMLWAARSYMKARMTSEWTKTLPAMSTMHSPHSVDLSTIQPQVLEVWKDGYLKHVSYRQLDAVSGIVVPSSGSIKSLIDALIFPTNQDSTYTEVFLASYRFFTTPMDLLHALISWHNVTLPNDSNSITPEQKLFYNAIRRPIQNRVGKILLIWVKDYWTDFQNNKHLLDLLMTFTNSVQETNFSDSQKLNQSIREQRLRWFTTQYIPLGGRVKSHTALGDNIHDDEPWITTLEPEDFANQMTLIEAFLFSKIKPDIYLSIMQTPALRYGAGSNVGLKVLVEHVLWFKLLSNYVTSVLAQQESSKKQVKVLKIFIKIMRACRSLNNFASIFAMMHGLKRPVVAKLVHVWESLPAKYLDVFQKLEYIVDSKNGYENYWTELRNSSVPLVPFLAAHFHDVLDLYDTVPTTLSTESESSSPTHHQHQNYHHDTIINFTKFIDLDSLICEMEYYRVSTHEPATGIDSQDHTTSYPSRQPIQADHRSDVSGALYYHITEWNFYLQDRIMDNKEGMHRILESFGWDYSTMASTDVYNNFYPESQGADLQGLRQGMGGMQVSSSSHSPASSSSTGRMTSVGSSGGLKKKMSTFFGLKK